MTIELVDLAIEHGGSFHSYVAVYQRVSSNIYIYIYIYKQKREVGINCITVSNTNASNVG